MVFDNYLLTIVVTFVAGFGVGSIYGWKMASQSISIDEKMFRRIVSALITITWILAVGSDILLASYNMPIALHGIMGATAGYLFSDGGLDITIGQG